MGYATEFRDQALMQDTHRCGERRKNWLQLTVRPMPKVRVEGRMLHMQS
jgi:hypothetical protein